MYCFLFIQAILQKLLDHETFKWDSVTHSQWNDGCSEATMGRNLLPQTMKEMAEQQTMLSSINSPSSLISNKCEQPDVPRWDGSWQEIKGKIMSITPRIQFVVPFSFQPASFLAKDIMNACVVWVLMEGVYIWATYPKKARKFDLSLVWFAMLFKIWGQFLKGKFNAIIVFGLHERGIVMFGLFPKSL